MVRVVGQYLILPATGAGQTGNGLTGMSLKAMMMGMFFSATIGIAQEILNLAIVDLPCTYMSPRHVLGGRERIAVIIWPVNLVMSRELQKQEAALQQPHSELKSLPR